MSAEALEDFANDLQRIEQQLPEAVNDLHVGAFVAAYGVAIERTPVRTGALRAENVVMANERLVYESPSRPGPDAIVDFVPGMAPIAPPSPGDAKAALASASLLAGLTILNQRFYASNVHDGDSRMAPRPWLQHAADTYERSVEGAEKILDERLR